MPTRVSGADVLATGTDGTSYTAPTDFNVVGGADHILIAVVEQPQNTGFATAVTAEGVAMTPAYGRAHASGASYPAISIWYLMNPSPGLTTIVASGGSARGCVIHCEEWSGVDTADPIGAVATFENTTGDVTRSFTPEASGNFVISAQAARSATAAGPYFTPDNSTEVTDTSTGGLTSTSDIRAWVGYYTTVGTSAVNLGAVNTSLGNQLWVAAEFRASSGTTYNLTATGVSSATSVATPALGQIHSVVATGVSSASNVATPALGQVHSLTVTGVSSTSNVSTPTLGQVYSLTATGVSSTSNVANPPLAIVGVLTAVGISSASSVANPALGQKHVLTAVGISSASAVANPALGLKYALTAIGVSSASTVANPALGSVYSLTAVGVSSASAVDKPALGQKHALVTPGVTSSSSVANPAPGQKHALTAVGVTSASKVGTPAIAGIDALTALGIKSNIFVATPVLHQTHKLSAKNIYSNVFVGQPNIPVPGMGLSKVTRKKPYRYIPIQHPDKNIDSLHQVVVQLKLVMEMVQNTLKDSDNG